MIRIFVLTGIGLLLAAGGLQYHTSRFDSIIEQAAARNDLDFYLVKALISEESWFRPQARGRAEELGLMQITPAAARDYTNRKGLPPFRGDQFMEPELNVEIGCWYLKQSLDRYKNSPNPTLFALLRYNAGDSRSDVWLKAALAAPKPPDISLEAHYLAQVSFPKTRAYARRILKRHRNRFFWF